MKILQIPNYIYPHIGGIEQTARDILNALASREDIEQRVICFNDGSRKNVFDEVDGVKVTRCGTVAKLFSQSVSLSYGRLLKRTVKEFKPDLIIFHYPNPFVAHYLLKAIKKSGCKLIVWWHLDITKQKILGKLFDGQSKRLLNRADRVIATSPNYVKGSKFLGEVIDKCTVIPSCINEKRFVMTDEDFRRRDGLRAENSGKTILFAMGRHVGHKGFDYIVRASKELGEDFKIFIAGEGDKTKELKKLAAGDGKIVFLGKISDADMRLYMSACDIFLFASLTKHEAFGLALAEAMYFGKPAVTFTIEGSGVNYVSLNGVTGIEVENGNQAAFTRAIKTLAADEVLREKYGSAAKARVEENFLFGTFAENVSALIGEMQ